MKLGISVLAVLSLSVRGVIADLEVWGHICGASDTYWEDTYLGPMSQGACHNNRSIMGDAWLGQGEWYAENPCNSNEEFLAIQNGNEWNCEIIVSLLFLAVCPLSLRF